MWTERFEGENLSLSFSPLIMILRGSKIKEDPDGGGGVAGGGIWEGRKRNRMEFSLNCSTAFFHACVYVAVQCRG